MKPRDSWHTATFAELIESGALQIGDGYRAKNEELGGTGPIFLRAGHVSDETIDFTGVERFHANLAERVRPKMAQAGDAVITTKGNSTGRVTYVHDRLPPFVYSPHLSYWRSCRPDSLVPRFLYYWSRSAEFKSQLRGMSASTDMAPYLSLQDQKRLKITIPPPSHQKLVADVLGALDDKIELNRRMNETLEDMARALFTSWFVDFVPVHAKAAARRQHPNWSNAQVSHDALPDLAADIAELFSDNFENSELGPVPAGWTVQRLGDLAARIGSGATPRGGSKVYVDKGTALVRSQNVYDYEFVWEGLAHITPEAAEDLDGVALECEDVLFNITGASILRTCVVDQDVLPARVNQHVARIRARPPVSSRFIHLHLVRKEMKDYLIGFNAGATREAITKGHLESVPLPTPPDNLFKAFDCMVSPIYTEKQRYLRQIRLLSAARDALLPKLLSGELCQ